MNFCTHLSNRDEPWVLVPKCALRICYKVSMTSSLYIKCCSLRVCVCVCVCRTALILACEHVCREVVEVLLKHKADVTTVDLHGHDLCHYARLSGDQALIMMIKQAWDAASKGKSSKASSSLTLGRKTCTWQDLASSSIVLIQPILLPLKHGCTCSTYNTFFCWLQILQGDIRVM